MRDFARTMDEIEAMRESANEVTSNMNNSLESMGQRLNPLMSSTTEEISSVAGTSIGSWGFADDSVLTSNVSILDDSVFGGRDTLDSSIETESITTSWGSSAVFNLNSADHVTANGMNEVGKRFEKALGTGQLNEAVIKIAPVSNLRIQIRMIIT